MAECEISGHLIYCWVKTGLILTDETYKSADAETRAEWNNACDEWAALSRQQQRALQRQWLNGPSKEGL